MEIPELHPLEIAIQQSIFSISPAGDFDLRSSTGLMLRNVVIETVNVTHSIMLWSVRVSISVAINVFPSYNHHSLWRRIVVYRMMLHAAEGTGDLQFLLSKGIVITERSASFIPQVTLSPDFFFFQHGDVI